MTTSNTNWHPVHQCNDGMFNTASGIKMDIKNPQPHMFTLTDIATGLGNICRFGGQLGKFYSVAQHSILVMYLAPAELKKAALLHDASEAYLGDVIKPFKVILGNAYSHFEASFMRVISEKYGVTESELDRVKQYDRIALEIEHNAFQRGNMNAWSEMWDKEIGYKYACWNPAFSQVKFIDYAGSLGLIAKEVQSGKN